jgi:hypothetical protein
MRTFGHPWKRRSHCSFVPSPAGLDHDRCSFDDKIIRVSELVLRDFIRRILTAQLSDRIDPRTHQLVPKVRSSPTLTLPPPACPVPRALLFFPHLQPSNIRTKARSFVSCVQKLSLKHCDVTVLIRAWSFVRDVWGRRGRSLTCATFNWTQLVFCFVGCAGLDVSKDSDPEICAQV